MGIDFNALADIEDGNQGWRSAFPDLSKTYVAGEGDNPLAFIVGEAPGAQEEIARRPFVGSAGIVLRDLMDIANLWSTDSSCDPSRPANCWLTNVVKFRPPRNRRPTPDEITCARPFLRAEWVAVGMPRLIIPVGGVALTAVTGKNQSIMRLAGRCHPYTSTEGLALFVWPMIHPSYGLRNPAIQPLIESDWDNLAGWMRIEMPNLIGHL